jgi:hypothetical protein
VSQTDMDRDILSVHIVVNNIQIYIHHGTLSLSRSINIHTHSMYIEIRGCPKHIDIPGCYKYHGTIYIHIYIYIYIHI